MHARITDGIINLSAVWKRNGCMGGQTECMGRTEHPRLEMATDSVPTEPNPNTCTRDSSTASHCYVDCMCDLAVRLLSNRVRMVSFGTSTIGMNLEISPQVSCKAVTLFRCFRSQIAVPKFGMVWHCIVFRHQGTPHTSTLLFNGTLGLSLSLSLFFSNPSIWALHRSRNITNMYAIVSTTTLAHLPTKHARKPALPRFGSNPVPTSRMHALWKSENSVKVSCVPAYARNQRFFHFMTASAAGCGLRTRRCGITTTSPRLVSSLIVFERDRTFTCSRALDLTKIETRELRAVY